MSTNKEMQGVILEELQNIAPEIEPDEIDPDENLRDAIDIDSMDLLNLVTALHERLGVDIPESDYPQMDTLANAAAYLVRRTGG